MSIYLNPDNENFSSCTKTELFVDKTLMLSELNKIIGTSEKYICISRPRRFGKSLAGNMICAYYSKGCNSDELFNKLNIAKTENFVNYLNKFNVLKFDLNDIYNNKPQNTSVVEYLTSQIIPEFKQEFTDTDFSNLSNIADCIKKLYSEKKEKFIIIIDEYDVLLRENADDFEISEYLKFLNGLFKNSSIEPAIIFAYLTGILPIIRDTIQSKLNNFEEFSMLDAANFTDFVGFTEEEVKSLCSKNNVSFSECERWYNGYNLNNKAIYSPRSVIDSIKRKRFYSYWATTSSYESLRKYILMNFDGIKSDVISMIAGNKIKVNVTKFLNTTKDFNSKDDVFTYLIHLGYLAYNQDDSTCYIPNKEIQNEWINSIEDCSKYSEIIQMISNSDKLLEATINCQEELVAIELEKAHSTVMSNLSYNQESSFQSAIILAYYSARSKYTVSLEYPTGKGYADVVFIPYVPNIPAIIVELKNNKTADTALEQIKQKKYFSSLEKYSGNIIIAGITYDEKTKLHECKIEKIVK